MKKLNQTGASHIVALVGVLVIAVLAFGAYRVMNANNTKNPATESATAATTATPATIQSKADVDQATKSLDSENVDGDVNPNQLNDDINSLL